MTKSKPTKIYSIELLEQRLFLTSVTSASFDYSRAPNAFIVTFDEDMHGKLTYKTPVLDLVSTGSSIGKLDLSLSADGKTATITAPYESSTYGVSGVLRDGYYRLSLSKLDVPSLAADWHFDAFSLSADANHDGTVDDQDAPDLQSGSPSFASGDFDYSGTVDDDDQDIFDAADGRQVTPPPSGGPSSISASYLGAGLGIQLNWNATSISGQTGYRISRSVNGNDATFGKTISGNGATTWTDTTVFPAGTTVYYRIRADGTGARTAYTPKSVALIPPPDLTAAPDLRDVVLNWPDQWSDETGVDIQSLNSSGGYDTVGHASTNSTTFTVPGLTLDTAYTFRLKVSHSGGAADTYTSTVATRTLPNINITSFDYQDAPNSVAVSFDQNVTGMVNGNTFTLDNVNTGVQITGLGVLVSSDGHTVTITAPNENHSRSGHLGVLPDGYYRLTVSHYDLAGLAADWHQDFFNLTGDVNHNGKVDSDDYYQIDWGYRHRNDPGFVANWSDGDFNFDGQINASDYALIDSAYQATPPQAPVTDPGVTTVSYINSSTPGFAINWNADAVSGETGWRIQRSTDGGHTFDTYWNVTDQNTGIGAFVDTDSTLPKGTEIFYRVHAYGNGQDTAYTPKVYGASPLPAATNVTLTNRLADTVTVNWNYSSTSATGFEVQTTADDWQTVQTTAVSADARSATVSALTTDSFQAQVVAMHVSSALAISVVSAPIRISVPIFVPAEPEVEITGLPSTSEGSLYTLNLNGGAAPISQWVINWGEPGIAATTVAGTATSVSHYFSDGTANRTVVATATSRGATLFSNPQQVHVNNVAPTAIAYNDLNVVAGSKFRLPLASFSDPGFHSETFTASINWDDGSAAGGGTAVVSHDGSGGNVTTGVASGEHTYTNTTAHDYHVAITVADKDSGTSTVQATIHVQPAPTPYVVPSVSGSPKTTLNFTITNLPQDASYHNELGWIEVNDSDFNLTGSPAQGTAAYVAAAVNQQPNPVVFARGAIAGETFPLTIDAGKTLAFFLVQDDTTADYKNQTPINDHLAERALVDPTRPNVWFVNAAANLDGYQHFHETSLSTTTKLYEAEDFTGGGDQDFNDFVFTVGPDNTDHAPKFDTMPPKVYDPSEAALDPSQFTINATIRDFQPNTPSDFQRDGSLTTGLVNSQLDPDTGLPVLTTNATKLASAGIASSDSFYDWYHDVPGTNLRTVYPMTFTKSNGLYTLNETNSFFPINGQLFGNQNKVDDGDGHISYVNGNFTAEIHSTFTYHAESDPTKQQIFKFTGDDDVWVFINGHLAIDLGGIHSNKTEATFTLDAATAASWGLADGVTTTFDMFTAERNIGTSDFYASTNLPLGINHLYDYSSHATDTDPGDQANLVYSILQAPAGATIDSNTGDLQWKPPAKGIYHFEIKVTDPSGLFDVQPWDVDASAATSDNPPKVIKNVAPMNQASVTRNYLSEVDNAFFDPDGDPLTFSSNNLPHWLTLDPSGSLHGTPASTDRHGLQSFTVKATDDRGMSVSSSFPITVDYYAASELALKSITTGDYFVNLTWENSRENDLIGYNVLHKDTAGQWQPLLLNGSTLIPKQDGETTTFIDSTNAANTQNSTPRVGYRNDYEVIALTNADNHPLTSYPIADHILVKDHVLPAVPTGVSVVGTDVGAEDEMVTVSWNNASREPDLDHYGIFEETKPIGDGNGFGTLIDIAPDATPSYTFPDPNNEDIAFGVYSVDYSGNQSPGDVVMHPVDGGPTIVTPAHTVDVTPGDPVTGTSVQLAVLGGDVDGESTLTYTWAAIDNPPAAVAFSEGNGANSGKAVTATFSKAGNYNIRVIITNQDGQSLSDALEVVVQQTLQSLALSPSAIFVPLSTSTQLSQTTLTALGQDQFGASMSVSTAQWAMDGDGTIDAATGEYTAPQSGTAAEIEVTSGAFTADAYIAFGEQQETISAVAPFTSQVNLSWQDLNESGVTYQVYGSDSPTFAINEDNNVASTQTLAATDDYLSGGTNYTYYVFADDGGAVMQLLGSTTVQTPTTDPSATYSAPTNALAMWVNKREFFVNWSPPSQLPPAYRIEVSDDFSATNSGTWYPEAIISSRATSTIIRRSGRNQSAFLTTSKTYWVRVACCTGVQATTSRDVFGDLHTLYSLPGTALSSFSSPASVEDHQVNYDTKDRDSDIEMVYPGNSWDIEKITSGIYLERNQNGWLYLEGATAIDNGVGKLWADLVNKGYNAYIAPLPVDDPAGRRTFNHWATTSDGYTLFAASNSDGSGLVFDEIIDQYVITSNLVGFGWSYGGGYLDQVEGKLVDSSNSLLFTKRMRLTETADPVVYGIPRHLPNFKNAPLYWVNWFEKKDHFGHLEYAIENHEVHVLSHSAMGQTLSAIFQYEGDIEFHLGTYDE